MPRPSHLAGKSSLMRKILFGHNYHFGEEYHTFQCSWEPEEDASAAADKPFAKWLLHCTPVVNWEHVKWIESSLLWERGTIWQRLGGMRRII